jgi:hypothetical protein
MPPRACRPGNATFLCKHRADMRRLSPTSPAFTQVIWNQRGLWQSFFEAGGETLGGDQQQTLMVKSKGIDHRSRVPGRYGYVDIMSESN